MNAKTHNQTKMRPKIISMFNLSSNWFNHQSLREGFGARASPKVLIRLPRMSTCAN